jgi:hypothetical protein
MPRSVSFVQWTVLLVLVLWAPTARSDNDSDAHLSSMQTAAEKQLVLLPFSEDQEPPASPAPYCAIRLLCFLSHFETTGPIFQSALKVN